MKLISIVIFKLNCGAQALFFMLGLTQLQHYLTLQQPYFKFPQYVINLTLNMKLGPRSISILAHTNCNPTLEVLILTNMPSLETYY